MQIPCKSHFSPILRNGPEAVLKRTWNGGIAKAQRRQSEGREDNSIKQSEKAFVEEESKKIKSFCEGGYTNAKIWLLHIDYQ